MLIDLPIFLLLIHFNLSSYSSDVQVKTKNSKKIDTRQWKRQYNWP